MPYLDHAATTPMLPEAIAAYTQQLADTGNASSLHSAGRRARRVVEESRETVARALGARPSEVVFTGGGTESINLALKGLYWARRDAAAARRRIIAAKVEHHAVLDPLQWLADHEGAEITWLPVDGLGRVAPAVLDAAIAEDPDSVAFTTVMWANNEIGTVQPIADLVAVAHTYDIPIHSDAIQAVGQLPVDFGASGLDAMTVTGHKFGGPYGVGALLLGRKVEVTPLLHGGGQERDVRSGTLDSPGIAAFATAMEITVGEQPERATALAELRDDLISRVLDVAGDAVLNGPGPDENGGPPIELRLPGNAHFCFPGCEGDSLLLLLDAQGIEVSTGSACSAGVAQPSHVLLAIGSPPDLARGSLRFSLGHTSSKADVDALIDALPAVLDRARTAGLS